MEIYILFYCHTLIQIVDMKCHYIEEFTIYDNFASQTANNIWKFYDVNKGVSRKLQTNRSS